MGWRWRSGVVRTGLGLAVWGTLAGTPAEADHGGALRLRSEQVGGYAISVWTAPSPPRPGPLRVVVAVMRERTQAPVLDATVRVAVARADGGALAAAGEGDRRDDPLGIRYVARVSLPAAGAWQVTVRVGGPAGGGDVSFPLQVAPTSAGWTPWGAALAGAGIAAGWLVWGRRAAPGGARRAGLGPDEHARLTPGAPVAPHGGPAPAAPVPGPGGPSP